MEREKESGKGEDLKKEDGGREECGSSSSITLEIMGNDDGMTFRLEVIGDNLQEVEGTFTRVFDRVCYLLNGKKDERKEVM